MAKPGKINLSIFRSSDITGKLANIALFVVLTLVIHFSFRWWAYEQHYRFLGYTIISIDFLNDMGRIVFENTVWLVNEVFRFDARIVGNIIYMPDGGGVAVDGACSGFKQMLQFALLILLIPGPLKHKAWFIPVGILLMHITNVIRVFGLCLVMWIDPYKFDLFHEYVFRPIFYIVIFGLWLIWTELLRPRRKVSPEQSPAE